MHGAIMTRAIEMPTHTGGGGGGGGGGFGGGGAGVGMEGWAWSNNGVTDEFIVASLRSHGDPQSVREELHRLHLLGALPEHLERHLRWPASPPAAMVSEADVLSTVRAMIDGLPILDASSAQGDAEQVDSCCPVCLEELAERPACRGACGHAAHVECLVAWLTTARDHRCPVCRTVLVPPTPTHPVAQT